jgi:hypothetical protein
MPLQVLAHHNQQTQPLQSQANPDAPPASPPSPEHAVVERQQVDNTLALLLCKVLAGEEPKGGSYHYDGVSSSIRVVSKEQQAAAAGAAATGAGGAAGGAEKGEKAGAAAPAEGGAAQQGGESKPAEGAAAELKDQQQAGDTADKGDKAEEKKGETGDKDEKSGKGEKGEKASSSSGAAPMETDAAAPAAVKAEGDKAAPAAPAAASDAEKPAADGAAAAAGTDGAAGAAKPAPAAPVAATGAAAAAQQAPHFQKLLAHLAEQLCGTVLAPNNNSGMRKSAQVRATPCTVLRWLHLAPSPVAAALAAATFLTFLFHLPAIWRRCSCTPCLLTGVCAPSTAVRPAAVVPKHVLTCPRPLTPSCPQAAMEVVSQVMGQPVSHWLNAILAKLNPQLQQRRITPVKGVAYATHQVSGLLCWG